MLKYGFSPCLEGFISRSGNPETFRYAFERSAQYLSLEELVKLTGLKSSTIKNHGLNTPFNYQAVDVDVDETRGAIYRLVEDQPSTNNPEGPRP